MSAVDYTGTKSRAEAEAIASTVRKFWLDQGFDVRVEVVEIVNAPKRGARPFSKWIVRSDLVNGMPRPPQHIRRAAA